MSSEPGVTDWFVVGKGVEDPTPREEQAQLVTAALIRIELYKVWGAGIM